MKILWWFLDLFLTDKDANYWDCVYNSYEEYYNEEDGELRVYGCTCPKNNRKLIYNCYVDPRWMGKCKYFKKDE